MANNRLFIVDTNPSFVITDPNKSDEPFHLANGYGEGWKLPPSYGDDPALFVNALLEWLDMRDWQASAGNAPTTLTIKTEANVSCAG